MEEKKVTGFFLLWLNLRAIFWGLIPDTMPASLANCCKCVTLHRLCGCLQKENRSLPCLVLAVFLPPLFLWMLFTHFVLGSQFWITCLVSEQDSLILFLSPLDFFVCGIWEQGMAGCLFWNCCRGVARSSPWNCFVWERSRLLVS